MNETIKAIIRRRSVRAYKPDPLPEETLAAILEAGQAAPYVMPDSRHFCVIRDKSRIARLSATAKAEGMKISDAHREMFSAPGFDGTYGASVVVIISGNESTIQYEGVCAASIQNILVAAQSLGVSSCWAYFPLFAFHSPEADSWREELHIPNGYKPCASVLLGYGTEATADETDERYKNAIVYL
jgi:nitroreductase